MKRKSRRAKRITKQVRMSAMYHHALKLKAVERGMTIAKLAEELLDPVLTKIFGNWSWRKLTSK